MRLWGPYFGTDLRTLLICDIMYRKSVVQYKQNELVIYLMNYLYLRRIKSHNARTLLENLRHISHHLVFIFA